MITAVRFTLFNIEINRAFEDITARIREINGNQHPCHPDDDADVPKEEWTLFTRVLEDPFHAMKRFEISASHGWAIQFWRSLRDAFFICDKDDELRVKTALENAKKKDPSGNDLD